MDQPPPEAAPSRCCELLKVAVGRVDHFHGRHRWPGRSARHENMQGDANVARKVVGLDIGTTAVRAAEVSVRHGQAVLERIGQAGLPEGPRPCC
jgi:hypothetical protein